MEKITTRKFLYFTECLKNYLNFLPTNFDEIVEKISLDENRNYLLLEEINKRAIDYINENSKKNFIPDSKEEKKFQNAKIFNYLWEHDTDLKEKDYVDALILEILDYSLSLLDCKFYSDFCKLKLEKINQDYCRFIEACKVQDDEYYTDNLDDFVIEDEEECDD